MVLHKTLNNLIIEYSENPFIDEKQYTRSIAKHPVKKEKLNIIEKIQKKVSLHLENKMEEMRATLRSIQSNV